MATYDSITMEGSEALTFWTRWARKHDKQYPLLARALPRWKEFFPEEAAPREDIWDPDDQKSSPIYWEDDMAVGRPWMAEDSFEMAPDVLEAVTEVLNRAAFDRLLQITTSGPEEMSVWEELSYEKLWEMVRATTDPLQHFALMDGPVEATTQITWFASWWIQSWEPPAVPRPAWTRYTEVAENYPNPAWFDQDRPPIPRWFAEWLHEWMEDNYGIDGEDWYQAKAF